MRPVACVLIAFILAACSGTTTSTSAPASPSGSTSPSASQPAETAAAPSTIASSAAVSAPIVGEWVRTASCDEALAAFEKAGLADQVPAWVIGNFVSERASAAPGKECANARPPVPHSHFFTADGQFGSRDENGQDVDSGDYRVVDTDTLSFGSHAQEFGYAGDILVDYSIAGDEVTFSVSVPDPCDAACRVAYGWAMSAFFGPRPFERT
jgi:hypothetical protein